MTCEYHYRHTFIDSYCTIIQDTVKTFPCRNPLLSLASSPSLRPYHIVSVLNDPFALEISSDMEATVLVQQHHQPQRKDMDLILHKAISHPDRETKTPLVDLRFARSAATIPY